MLVLEVFIIVVVVGLVQAISLLPFQALRITGPIAPANNVVGIVIIEIVCRCVPAWIQVAGRQLVIELQTPLRQLGIPHNDDVILNRVVIPQIIHALDHRPSAFA